MCASAWRERREAYLRECGRWADLLREGYVDNRFAVIEGDSARVRCGAGSEKPALILLRTSAGDLRERVEARECSQENRQPQPCEAGDASVAGQDAEGDFHGEAGRLIALAPRGRSSKWRSTNEEKNKCRKD